jgi:hypothetical protein
MVIPESINRNDSYGIAIGNNFKNDSLKINFLIDRLNESDTIERLRKKYVEIEPIGMGKSQKYFVSLFAIIGVPILVMSWLVFSNRVKSGDPQREKKIIPELPEGPVNYCIIFANSSYENGDDLSKLPFNDAEKFQNALSDYGFSKDNIVILRDVTRKGMLQAFQEIASRLESDVIPFTTYIRKTDNLIVYYTGHGDVLKVGGKRIGFWRPVDGSDFWNLLPDYEIKFYLNLVQINRVLLIADSCFSATLITPESNPKNGSIKVYTDKPCIEIIASGNVRVPDESEFNSHLVEILKDNPKSQLLSHEIYEALKTRLSYKGYYQPQYGSIWKAQQNARFSLTKATALRPFQDPVIADTVRSIVEWFKSNDLRMVKYSRLKSEIGIQDALIDKSLEHMVENRIVHVTKDNLVFLTPKVL